MEHVQLLSGVLQMHKALNILIPPYFFCILFLDKQELLAAHIKIQHPANSSTQETC